MSYYIGVDVGTGSARAVLVDDHGKTIASHTKETTTWRDHDDHRIFEQSTNNIWDSISSCIQKCLAESKVQPSSVKGLSFDATCSLAVSDFNGDPVVVTKGKNLGQKGDRNVILWADHRAEKEAELINSTGSVVLDYVGGTMSVSAPNKRWSMYLDADLNHSLRWKFLKHFGSKTIWSLPYLRVANFSISRTF